MIAGYMDSLDVWTKNYIYLLSETEDKSAATGLLLGKSVDLISTFSRNIKWMKKYAESLECKANACIMISDSGEIFLSIVE